MSDGQRSSKSIREGSGSALVVPSRDPTFLRGDVHGRLVVSVAVAVVDNDAAEV